MFLALSLLALWSLAAATQCPPPDSVQFLIPHETDCSKFYICSHGTPVLQTCPDGTHFNPNFMVCQNPVFAGCSSELPEAELPCDWPSSILFRPHPDTCSKYYVCEYGVPIVFDCPAGLEFDSKLMECVWPHESDCARVDGADLPYSPGSQDGTCQSGALSAHQDCSKYNICDHGALVAKDCASGLQWSSKVEQCVWPNESDCNTKDDAEPQDGADSQDGACQSGALSAHEDCSKYNICDHGALVAKDCPSGLQWSSKVEQCVWPNESDCNTKDDTEPQNGTDSQDGACQSGALSAHEDCSKYNICDHGALVAKDCPSGLQWSSKVEQCVWPNESDCNTKDDTEPQNGTDSQDGACQSGALSAHEDCSKYNICDHGALVAKDCPSGLQWSSKVEQCVWPNESDCNTKDDVEPQDGADSQDGACQIGALSAHEDCSKYNICDHGALVAKDCASGLQWSSKVEQCVWPNESDCNTKDADSQYDADSQDGAGSQDGACQIGALSAHEDCGKYNICDHGALVAKDCFPGLHWNSKAQVCDWPSAAGCA